MLVLIVNIIKINYMFVIKEVLVICIWKMLYNLLKNIEK